MDRPRSVEARNPRAEAQERLPDGYSARVLEPSPPAVDDGEWFADHPVDPSGSGDSVVVSPVSSGDATWDEVARDHSGLTEYVDAHWLSRHGRLPAPPAGLIDTVFELRRLAFFVMSPARQKANGKIALRYTHGGFGTPFFGDDQQIRVEGTRLIRQERDTAEAVPISTLRAAGDFAGVEPGAPTGIDFHDAPGIGSVDEALKVDDAAAHFLGDWFGFSTLVLEELLVRAGSPTDTRVQLWTEHFDPAIELGSADAGQRASYGASPGDEAHPEPYLYVAPWSPHEGPFWSDPAFGGAALAVADILGTDDHVGAALDFFFEGYRLLTGG